jgi:hypothetical protein
MRRCHILVKSWYGKAVNPCYRALIIIRAILFYLALEVLASDEFGNVVVIGITVLSVLCHVLVALGELAEGGEGVGAELVEDARHQLSQLLVLTGTVDGEGVGWDGGVD